MRIVITPILTLLLALTVGCTKGSQASSEEVSYLQTRVETVEVPKFVLNDPDSRKLWDSTKQVYTLRQFQPAFVTDTTTQSDVDVVLRTLSNAASEGLNPEDYALSQLRSRRASLETANSTARNDFELQMTYALTRYVSQLCFGRIDPKKIKSEWPEAQNECDVPHLVNEALDQNSVETLAERLAPPVPEYQALKAGLQKYRDIAASGGWHSLPLPIKKTGKKPGNRVEPAGPAVLAQNLSLMGDLESPIGDQPVSKESLKEALSRFQSRHGLNPNGVLDKETIKAMNVPVEERIAQMETNLDRMRWIGHRLEDEHIRVNIPGFHLAVHEGDQVPLEMRVIVGTKDNRTPLLDSTIVNVVFSPYWNIPLSIATKEMLPQIRKDPSFLRNQEMEVVRISGGKVQTVDPDSIDWNSSGGGYQLRQRPGASNALGLVKFLFPNPYNVYLHDTPSDNLFDRLTRTLSHGCVRIEKPTMLASYLLRGQPEWTDAKIDEAMHASKERYVALKTKVPIHLIYWTAWGDSDGKVQFRDDVYGYDEIHRQAVSPPLGV